MADIVRRASYQGVQWMPAMRTWHRRLDRAWDQRQGCGSVRLVGFCIVVDWLWRRPEALDPEKCAQLSDLKRIYPIFQEWKESMNVVDYGDMISSAYQLLNSNETILQKVQSLSLIHI